MKQHYIYMTTDHLHHKKYIGKRYGELNDDYFGSGKIISRVIQKYGKSILTKEILYISKDATENNQKEKEFIALFNAIKSNDFYNIAEGGDGGDIFHTLPLEQQELLRQQCSLRTRGENNPRYGVHLSEETKEKIRRNRDTSFTQTENYRKKMSEAMKGEKNGMYGKHHTEESKKKMSENRKGLTVGEKNGMFGKRDNAAINGKKIEMLNSQGEILQIFCSKKMALKFLGLKGHLGLDKAIQDGTMYKGYFWRKNSSVETKIKE